MFNIKSLRNNFFYSSISMIIPPPVKQGLMTLAGLLTAPRIIHATIPPSNPVDIAVSSLFLAVSVIGFFEVGESENALNELNKAGKLIPSIQHDEDQQIQKIEELTRKEEEEKQTLILLREKIEALEIEKNNLKDSESRSLKDIEELHVSIENLQENLALAETRYTEKQDKIKQSEEHLKAVIQEKNSLMDRMKTVIERLRQQLRDHGIQPLH